MSTIVNGDKVVLIHQFDKLYMVGTQYEIGDITELGIIIRSIKDKVARACVSYEDFNKHFILSKDMDTKRVWTEWTAFLGNNKELLGFYRTNRKKVQVKHIDGHTKAESSCYPTDQFNIYIGLNLAYTKLRIKILRESIEKDTNALNECYQKLRDIIDNVKPME